MLAACAPTRPGRAVGREAGLLQVLHMDRNNYYGGASASLNLTQACPTARGGKLALPIRWTLVWRTPRCTCSVNDPAAAARQRSWVPEQV